MSEIIVIGGGLAGSEAAWQVAERGLDVILYEMRPVNQTPAHKTGYLAELVCSNSLGSNLPDRAAGVLKNELRRMDSLLLNCAENAFVPAGGALAVDRQLFSELVTDKILSHQNITVIREEIQEIPAGPAIIASGPLTSQGLSDAIKNMSGREHLYFFDAIAPIISLESINLDVAFRGSRYQRGMSETGDYINCPMNRQEYEQFWDALVHAERISLEEYELGPESGVQAGNQQHFEGCLPIEVMATRGQQVLAFGPLRPVGLIDPRTGKRPFAVVQLRQDNLIGTLYNLVGFQTNLKYSEQSRLLRMIPGLENAEIVRYGQMHRNTFINSPMLLNPTLQWKEREDLFFAGQITGVEGYTANIATGLLAGWNISRWKKNQDSLEFPITTMLGALCFYITHASPADFQPMKPNFGLMPPLDKSNAYNRRARAKGYAERSQTDLDDFLKLHGYA
jgi:methylenetetrahydrofolate--tRNA-(uracil-5-)-methyltransferase